MSLNSWRMLIGKKATNLGDLATRDASTAKALIALYEKPLKYYQDEEDTTNTRTLFAILP